MHDLVIRHGTIVDGTRQPAFIGDVAIDAGRITAVGKVPADGRTEIDATGLYVAPGFVDIHTRHDGQPFGKAKWPPAAGMAAPPS